MIQDMLVPLKHLHTSIDYFDKEVNMYPLWFCPFWLPNQPGFLQKAVDTAGAHESSLDGQMYVDIGAYGEPRIPNFEFRPHTRNLEAFVRKHDGSVKYCPHLYIELSFCRLINRLID